MDPGEQRASSTGRVAEEAAGPSSRDPPWPCRGPSTREALQCINGGVSGHAQGWTRRKWVGQRDDLRACFAFFAACARSLQRAVSLPALVARTRMLTRHSFQPCGVESRDAGGRGANHFLPAQSAFRGPCSRTLIYFFFKQARWFNERRAPLGSRVDPKKPLHAHVSETAYPA